MARITRSSQNSNQSTPPSATKASTKRSADNSSSPPAKRGRPSKKAKAEKEQKTIEETVPKGNNSEKDQETVDETMKNVDEVEEESDVAKQINGISEEDSGSKEEKGDAKAESEVSKQESSRSGGSKEDVGDREGGEKANEENSIKKAEKSAFDEVKADTGEAKEAAQANQDKKAEQDKKTEHNTLNDESGIEDAKREAAVPSSILEKGVVYFFFRGRVGVEDPQGIEDIARSYIVLRPLPIGAKLGEGPLEDSGKARLLVLPKKMLPKSKQDRFLMFVEKPRAFIKDLRDQFASTEYATKTSGTSRIPAATPVAEGIYAITSTGRESHLAYQITVPEIGEIQKELGLKEKGSFVVSVKNPNAPGPANATLDNPANYPESIQKKFRNLRWSPLEPEMLDYENTQFLIIGESFGQLGRAVEEQSKDKKDVEKEAPVEEMEKLEEEDHDRVEHLKEDDPIFADLGLSSKEYPKMQTTW